MAEGMDLGQIGIAGLADADADADDNYSYGFSDEDEKVEDDDDESFEEWVEIEVEIRSDSEGDVEVITISDSENEVEEISKSDSEGEIEEITISDSEDSPEDVRGGTFDTGCKSPEPEVSREPFEDQDMASYSETGEPETEMQILSAYSLQPLPMIPTNESQAQLISSNDEYADMPKLEPELPQPAPPATPLKTKSILLCPYCPKVFILRVYVHRHIIAKHSNETLGFDKMPEIARRDVPTSELVVTSAEDSDDEEGPPVLEIQVQVDLGNLPAPNSGTTPSDVDSPNSGTAFPALSDVDNEGDQEGNCGGRRRRHSRRRSRTPARFTTEYEYYSDYDVYSDISDSEHTSKRTKRGKSKRRGSAGKVDKPKPNASKVKVNEPKLKTNPSKVIKPKSNPAAEPVKRKARPGRPESLKRFSMEESLAAVGHTKGGDNGGAREDVTGQRQGDGHTQGDANKEKQVDGDSKDNLNLQIGNPNDLQLTRSCSKVYGCPYCGANFINQESAAAHVLTHINNLMSKGCVQPSGPGKHIWVDGTLGVTVQQRDPAKKTYSRSSRRGGGSSGGD